MKILMLSWEFPPKNIGGLSTHVNHLSHALAKLGHEVHVVTCEEGTAPVKELNNNVYVHRVSPYNISTDDFVKWVMHLNFAMVEEGYRIVQQYGKMDLIHAHDWLTTYAAKTLKWSLSIPIVSTIHATEAGRNGGIRTEMQRYISNTECLLADESSKLITCSNYMKNQVMESLRAKEERTVVIANGVSEIDSAIEFDKISFKRNYAQDYEKIVLFVGRHVYEKGLHLLIEAAPRIVDEYRDAKFVITGHGPITEDLKERVNHTIIKDKILFTGYIDDETRDKLYRIADVAVFPSLYEPFGIVSLEAMAAGCPVVVSDTGGLREIIDHGHNGLKMLNGSSNSLKDNVVEILKNQGLCDYIKENALKDVKEIYSWSKIGELTVNLYKDLIPKYKDTLWASDQLDKQEKEENIVTEKTVIESTELVETVAVEEGTKKEEEKVSPKNSEVKKENDKVAEMSNKEEKNVEEKKAEDQLKVNDITIEVASKPKTTPGKKRQTTKKATASTRTRTSKAKATEQKKPNVISKEKIQENFSDKVTVSIKTVAVDNSDDKNKEVKKSIDTDSE